MLFATVVVDGRTNKIPVLRFGLFELDQRASELRRSGRRVNLPPQPCKILALLAGRAGELVTREEIQEQVWGGETFVDFDQGLNFAIKKIRTALGDDADAPRFIETLPRRGYRFIGQIEAPAPAITEPASDLGTVGRQAIATLVDAVIEAHRARTRWRRVVTALIIAAVLAILLFALLAMNFSGSRDRLLRRGHADKIESLAVVPMENLRSSGTVFSGTSREGSASSRATPPRLRKTVRGPSRRRRRSADPG